MIGIGKDFICGFLQVTLNFKKIIKIEKLKKKVVFTTVEMDNNNVDIAQFVRENSQLIQNLINRNIEERPDLLSGRAVRHMFNDDAARECEFDLSEFLTVQDHIYCNHRELCPTKFWYHWKWDEIENLY